MPISRDPKEAPMFVLSLLAVLVLTALIGAAVALPLVAAARIDGRPDSPR